MFKAGEVAIFISDGMGHKAYEKYSGEDVTVLYPLPANFYQILWPCGTEGYCIDKCLRKKKPPEYDGNDVIQWDDCIWKPTEVTI